MKFYNWTLNVISPSIPEFGNTIVGEENAIKQLNALFWNASKEAGEKSSFVVEWLTNIGCAVEFIVFFDPLPFEKKKINLILLSHQDLESVLRDDRNKAPRSVSYYYSSKGWVGELESGNVTLRFPEWLLGSIASPHIMLSKPHDNGKDKPREDIKEKNKKIDQQSYRVIDPAYRVFLLSVTNCFPKNPEDVIADLIAADIYSLVTQKLPPEKSVRIMLPAFKKEMAEKGISSEEMTRMAVRTMQKRNVRRDLGEKVMRRFAQYR